MTCHTDLLAQGDLGHPSFVVSLRAKREGVLGELKSWWNHFDKARDLTALARVKEAFPAFVPVWRVHGRLVGWILGQESRKEGDRTVHVPVERRVLRGCEMNTAACDLEELGIPSVPLLAKDLEPFDEETIEKQGMIFRPVSPAREARELAEARFLEQGPADNLNVAVKQTLLGVVGVSLSLVYYPIWIIRYEYRERMYQAIADGASGHLLSARAPGNDMYRVVAFLAGIGGGAFLFTTFLRSLGSSNLPVLFGVLAPVALVYWGYRAFRYGAVVEHRTDDFVETIKKAAL